jgi:dimeric dUTPase (all-alpha-NTP-PPase superfamily)
MLDEIFAKQLALQINSFGGDPGELDDESKIEYIKSMTLAATDELHEALAEVGWKPWATSRHVNRDAYLGELIDVLHFWVNLCLAVGANAEEIAFRYNEKANRNAKRQAEGYDGVTGKCEHCKRALDDVH